MTSELHWKIINQKETLSDEYLSKTIFKNCKNKNGNNNVNYNFLSFRWSKIGGFYNLKSSWKRSFWQSNAG